MGTRPVIRDIIEGIVAVVTIIACASAEGLLLVKGAPPGLDGVVLGRILGTLDTAAIIVLTFYFGSTRASAQQVDAITSIGQAAANTPIHITMPNGTVIKTTTPAQEVASTVVHASTITTAATATPTATSEYPGSHT